MLKSEDWRALHDAVGDYVMRYLLTHCALFVALPNRNYMQVRRAKGGRGNTTLHGGGEHPRLMLHRDRGSHPSSRRTMQPLPPGTR